MNRKKNDFHFDIPIAVIIIALIFSFPVGVILTVLRLIFPPEKGSKKSNSDPLFGSDRETVNARNQSDYSAGVPSSHFATNRSKAKGKNSKVKKSLGTVLSTVLCVISLVLGVLGVFSVFDGPVGDIPQKLLQYVAPFLTVSGISYLFSLFFKQRDGRFNRIRALIGEKDSFNLTRIASVSKQSLKKVRKDVQQMIDKGEFGDDAYIDLSTNNFMRFADAEPDMTLGFDFRYKYDDPIFGKGKTDNSEKSEDGRTQNMSEEKTAEPDQFRSVILEIRRLNDDIHDFAVSEKIYRIEEYTQYIFDYVTEHPDAMPKIRTFMTYYLPTTLKLLESYRRIERMGATGENMKSSKEKIESILDLLVEGYKQQMDNLFQNESMDISSDISVLETMMQKDGLSGNKDFASSIDFDLGGMAAQQMPTDTEADIE